jgi:tetratricopeptide (TPR) repeat protein
MALLAALLVFGLVATWRLLGEWRPAAPSPAFDTSAPPPAALEAGDPRMVAQLQSRIRQEPENPAAYAALGLALLQQVRSSADPSLYTQAGQAFDEALKRDPQNLDALIGRGSLALSLHQFHEALRWGEQARAVNPHRAQVYGILGDAYVELGQYESALDAVQQMVDTRPDRSSYSRVSYLRELQGDTAGAISLMQQALAAGDSSSESARWTAVQLGHLYFNSGDLTRAETTYRQALQINPSFVHAQAGVARVQAARGQYAEAIAAYRQISAQLPLPEFVLALGELYEVTGQPDQARTQYDLVRAMQRLNASAGMDVDMELALFDAEHGTNPAQTVERARAAYSRRPSIHAADALAWALYKNGNAAEAQRYSQEALRLGTRDAAMHFRAGMIAHANGDRDTARQHLQTALNINPHFSLRHGPEARKLLAALKAG